MKSFAGSTEVDETEMDGLASVAAEFFEIRCGPTAGNCQ